MIAFSWALFIIYSKINNISLIVIIPIKNSFLESYIKAQYISSFINAFTISLKLKSELNTNTLEFSGAASYTLLFDKKSEKSDIIC